MRSLLIRGGSGMGRWRVLPKAGFNEDISRLFVGHVNGFLMGAACLVQKSLAIMNYGLLPSVVHW